MFEGQEDTLYDSSDSIQNDEPDKNGIKFTTDSACISTRSFNIQLNKDDKKKGHFELIEQMYQLRCDNTLSKKERTEKFDELIKEFKMKG
ncbi:hypothetical protein [Ruminiclostridium papyrosolvens]|uniref:Uncharacterized protein n=1 Tax=Ruminiclostridium papyrosolvens C7 TaxID=1330534 RepID=U4R033_9FIRM|nr:hypothetical protein [Ruminiclostridium papyrosolvens]EPR10476.1 hypothetical protein L323_12580 [Ruminiclostridium papyrosolvens C7]